MSPNDTHTDKAALPKVERACDKPAQYADSPPASSPCLLSTDEPNIDPNYLPDYSQGAK